MIGFYFNSFLTHFLLLFYAIIENYCADNQHFISYFKNKFGLCCLCLYHCINKSKQLLTI